MPRIFISYRRADSGAATEHIYAHLAQTFGDNNVFRDVHDIEAGEDFRARIEHEIITSDVMLVMIGRDWATIKASDGTRRIDNPADFVRQEVEMGLRHQLDVIPVLVFGAKMPDPTSLPPSLYDLAFRNAAPLRNPPHFDEDLKTLTKKLRRARLRTAKSSRVPAMLFGLALVMIAALAFIVATSRNNEQTEAITFLLDQSDRMLAPVKEGEETRFDMAKYVIAASINTELVMQERQTWVGLRTAGGGEYNDCDQTKQLISGTSEQVERRRFIDQLEQVKPGGNTAYVSGFSGAFRDLNQPETENRPLKFVFLMLGSIEPSKDCRLLDSVDIGRVMNEAKENNITLIVCALTFLDEKTFERFVPRLQSEGITCYDNATNEIEAKGMVQTVVNTISGARQRNGVVPNLEATLLITQVPTESPTPTETTTETAFTQEVTASINTAEATSLATSRALSAPPDGSCVHIVTSGQSLSTIAQLYGKTMAAIMEINNIANPNVVVVGQRLMIPPPCSPIQPTVSVSQTPQATATPEFTLTASTTAEATATPEFTMTASATGQATAESTATPEFTLTSSATESGQKSFTASPTVQATATTENTATFTASIENTATFTPSITLTPTETASPTATLPVANSGLGDQPISSGITSVVTSDVSFPDGMNSRSVKYTYSENLSQSFVRVTYSVSCSGTNVDTIEFHMVYSSINAQCGSSGSTVIFWNWQERFITTVVGCSTLKCDPLYGQFTITLLLQKVDITATPSPTQTPTASPTLEPPSQGGESAD